MLRVKKAEAIHRLAFRLARENGVRIYQYANSGNHLHLLLRARTRRGFQRFLRSFAALVPRIVTGAKKGAPLASLGKVCDTDADVRERGPRKFWDALAWSRIVSWGRHFFNGRYYVIRNELEAEGWVSYRPRNRSRESGGSEKARMRP